ncbi:precorrin-6A synthase (deacetylating) [Rhodopseudomonas sp. B29]|uniref:precorrin-6A synthase (deacetylating) n=1 Tax=Rhodopseudomonas sp. B29 TaxID=95607 RepID=UPI000347EB41|nr:precorrin-6A synthase (deacetylating) [Rhodopseudomonas sp. B29]
MSAPRQLLLIGIGAGDPDYLTMQAAAALNRADVFFIQDKGRDKQALRALRTQICERFITDRDYRMVAFDYPVRAKEFSDYKANVADWHADIEAIYTRLLRDELADGQCGAFLIWGDPALYDSTMRIIESIHARGDVAFDYEIIPGITAIQALAAKHRIALNRIGEPVHITTGRKLPAGAIEADSVVVMLDGEQAFTRIDPDTEIFWGAYLGTPDEVLIAGRLGDVRDRIVQTREAARQRIGWIMDTYLLRKPR